MANITELNERIEDCANEMQDIKGKILEIAEDLSVPVESGVDTPMSVLQGIQNSSGNYVPNTRKVNNKALSSDITLDASDVGALPSNTTYVSSVNGSSGAVTDIATTSDVNAKYTKPSGGIPKTDLESAVQTSLGLADTALQNVDNSPTQNSGNPVTSGGVYSALNDKLNKSGDTMTGALSFSQQQGIFLGGNGALPLIHANGNGGVEITARKEDSQQNNNTIEMFGERLYPSTNNSIDLGKSTNKFKNLYLNENISDGTNTVSVANLNNYMKYTTTAPSSANTDGLKIALLDSEPATKYDGWIYLIKE